MDGMDTTRITNAVLAALNQYTPKQQNGGLCIPVGVSARHVHLTREHVEVLFGKGAELIFKAGLMGGQFAAQQMVTVIGATLKAIENVRVIGPVRGFSQVELSATDARNIGINAPLRNSGDIAGSAPITLAGPSGAVFLHEGCIIAKRHIHLQTSEAHTAGFKDGDVVRVKCGGERGLEFGNVLVRTDISYTPEFHIDTDEANASGLKTGDTVIIC